MRIVVQFYDGEGNVIANSTRGQIPTDGGIRAAKRRAHDHCAEYMVYRGRRSFDFPRYFVASGPMGFYYEVRRESFYRMVDEAIDRSAQRRSA